MARKSLDIGFTGDITQETGAAAKARTAVARVRDEAGMVATHAVDHPAATGSAIAAVGLLAFAVGYMVGLSSSARAPSGWDRWR